MANASRPRRSASRRGGEVGRGILRSPLRHPPSTPESIAPRRRRRRPLRAAAPARIGPVDESLARAAPSSAVVTIGSTGRDRFLDARPAPPAGGYRVGASERRRVLRGFAIAPGATCRRLEEGARPSRAPVRSRGRAVAAARRPALPGSMDDAGRCCRPSRGARRAGPLPPDRVRRRRRQRPGAVL